jgi:hypothetical protein
MESESMEKDGMRGRKVHGTGDAKKPAMGMRALRAAAQARRSMRGWAGSI